VLGCLKHVRLNLLFRGAISKRLTVGLGIDCSPWVEAGLITHAGMLDRNWALWTTFCQVCPLNFARSAISDTPSGYYVVALRWARILYSVITGLPNSCALRYARFGSVPRPLASRGKGTPQLHLRYFFRHMLPNADCQGYCRCRVSETCKAFFGFGISDRLLQEQLFSPWSSPGRKRVPRSTDGVSITILPWYCIADIPFSLKLSSWKNDLPPEIDFCKANPCTPQPHQLMLHMTYHWLTILLHRPFCRRKRSCEDISDCTDHMKVLVIPDLCDSR
jgi:hypothetical protein